MFTNLIGYNFGNILVPVVLYNIGIPGTASTSGNITLTTSSDGASGLEVYYIDCLSKYQNYTKVDLTLSKTFTLDMSIFYSGQVLYRGTAQYSISGKTMTRQSMRHQHITTTSSVGQDINSLIQIVKVVGLF